MATRLVVVVISEHIQMSNHHLVHLKLTSYRMSTISQFYKAHRLLSPTLRVSHLVWDRPGVSSSNKLPRDADVAGLRAPFWEGQCCWSECHCLTSAALSLYYQYDGVGETPQGWWWEKSLEQCPSSLNVHHLGILLQWESAFLTGAHVTPMLLAHRQRTLYSSTLK